jgi:hypothetical protein
MRGKLPDQKPAKAAFGQRPGKIGGKTLGQLVQWAATVADPANDACLTNGTEKSDLATVTTGIGMLCNIVERLGRNNPEVLGLFAMDMGAQ